jgi:hypothetical protein
MVIAALLLNSSNPQDSNGLADPPNANAGVLPAVRRVRSAYDLPLAGLVGKPIADPKQHWEDAALGWRRRLGLLRGARSGRVN